MASVTSTTKVLTADTRLAAYIVGVMTLNGDLTFDVDDTSSENAQSLLYAVQNVRDALRQGLPQIDMTELAQIAKTAVIPC